MHRRTALRLLGSGLAGIAAVPLVLERSSRALAFGTAPSPAAGVPESLRVSSVLEVFLCGGVSQYESFYCVEEHGRDDRSHWHLFEQGAELAWAMQACGLSEPLLEPFGLDSVGQTVHLGPFAMPLRRRPDLLRRLRVCVTHHDLAPHEAAIPLALSGRTLGDPALAGVGAHVQRYFAETGDAGTGPCAYVLLSSSLNTVFIDNLRALTATGLHPAAARPLALEVDGATRFVDQLKRPAVGARREHFDALLSSYVEAYGAELTWAASGELLRAPAFSELRTAAATMTQVDELTQMFEPTLFSPRSGTSCEEAIALDSVSAQLEIAAHLLTHPLRPARYVAVVDGGFIPTSNGGGGYDSHTDNIRIQAQNLTHTLNRLARLIRQPDEDAPRKIDLDRTLIVFTTEFGRSPHAEGSTGRDHWPHGYAQALLGGPIREPGISGACGPDARRVHGATPAESRIAALLALGIWPFAPEAFGVSDVPGAVSEEDAALRVLNSQLGFT